MATTSPPPKKKKQLAENVSTTSETATYTGGVGSSNVNQTSFGNRGGGGGGDTVAVNPLTYQPDSNSTFRVSQSEVGHPPVGSGNRSVYTSGAGFDSRKNLLTSTPNSERPSTSINPVIKSLLRGEVSVADVKSGRAKAFETTVTPAEAQVLARQSLRQDVDGYKFSGVEVTPNKSVDLESQRRNQNILFKSNKNGSVVGENNPVKKQSVLYQQGELKQSKSQEFLFGKKEAVGFSSRTGTKVDIIGSSRGAVGVVKDLGVGFKSSVVDPLVSFGRGTGKLIQFEAQNPSKGGIGSWNPSEKSNLVEKKSKFKKLYKEDSDVKTATLGGGLLLSYPISSVPIIAVGTFQSVKGGVNIVKGLSSKDFVKVGEGVGDVVTGELTIKSFKRPFTELTKTKVRAEDVFGGEISGRKVTSKSTGEALRQFEAGRLSIGKVEVVSAGPSSLTGGKLVDIGAGPKGAAGLEDSGLFAGPKTRANLMFTGLGKEGGDSSLTVNPLTEIKRFFGKSPVVSTIVVSDIVTPQASVLGRAGFLNVNKEFVGEGVAVITKRSMIGKGEVKRQMFSPVQDFRSDSGLVRLKGKLYKEAGTSETEAVIPTGSVLKRVSNKEFTVVNQKKLFGYKIPFTGDVVELPRYELLSDGKNVKYSKKNLFDSKEVGLIDSSSQSNFRGGRKRSLSSGVDSYGKSNVGSTESFLSSKNSIISRSSDVGISGGSLVSGLSSKSFRNSFVSNSLSSSSNFVSGNFRSSKKGPSLVYGGQSSSPTSKVIGGSFQGSSFNKSQKVFSSSQEGFSRFKGVDSRFSVDVRSKGKFSTVGEGLNLKDAIKLGKGLTGSSSARSFKIRTQAGKNLTGLNLGKDYYKKGDVYIEKSGVAINTGGELKQITFKGIATQKNKRLGVF